MWLIIYAGVKIPDYSYICQSESSPSNLLGNLLKKNYVYLLTIRHKSNMVININVKHVHVLVTFWPNSTNKSIESTADSKCQALRNGTLQWNLSVTTTSKIKCITFDLFSNVF